MTNDEPVPSAPTTSQALPGSALDSQSALNPHSVDKSHSLDVEDLIQEAAAGVRQLQLAARIIARGAMRLASCSSGCSAGALEASPVPD